jgi:hypothetical protein
MKRILVFVLLGPPLGFAVFLLYEAVVSRSVPSLSYLAYTPWAYVVGGVPAAVAAALDYRLSAKAASVRLALTAIGGFVATVLFTVIVVRPSTSPLREILGFGFVGAIPAAVCSWLSGEKKKVGV